MPHLKTRIRNVTIAAIVFFVCVFSWVLWKSTKGEVPVSVKYLGHIDHTPINPHARAVSGIGQAELEIQIVNENLGPIMVLGPSLVEWNDARFDPPNTRAFISKVKLPPGLATTAQIPISGAAISSGGKWRILVPITDYRLGNIIERWVPISTLNRLFTSLLTGSTQWAKSPWYPQLSLNSDEILAKLTKHEDEIEVFIQGKVQEWTGATMRPAASPLKDSEWFELPIAILIKDFR